MTRSQHLLELNLNLQRRVAEVEQDNQQKKVELAQLRQEHGRLQESQARYRQVFENAPVSMLFINTEGYITQMNRAAEQLFGATMEYGFYTSGINLVCPSQPNELQNMMGDC